MLQACAQAVDFKVGHHFGEGHPYRQGLFACHSLIRIEFRPHLICMRPPRFDTAQLSLVRTPFDDPDFLFELKHDGFRALAHIWDGRCELISRKRNAYKSFQDLRDNLGKLKVQNAVIDGEIVCLDAEGRSIFNELLFRRACPVFYAFDILFLNDRDLRQLPLIERKEILRAVIEKSALPDVLCGKYVEGRGVDLYNEVVRRNLEGVVAKRKSGVYATVSDWLKIKNPNYSQSERRYELFESFKAKTSNTAKLPPVPKKPPLRAVPVRKTARKSRQAR
jgi:bifunctional non-homologous end joining protein LigD